MHHPPRTRSATRLPVLVAIVLLVGCGLLTAVDYPAWWNARGVIAPPPAGADDYAVLNQGQLKHLATAAYDEFKARLLGGAGPQLEALIKSWHQLDASGEFIYDGGGERVRLTTTQSDDFAIVNLGQLKAVAKPFYDRLAAAGMSAIFPWPAAGVADDFAAANIGQAKALFAIDFERDTDADGIADYFESMAGTNPFVFTAVPGSSGQPPPPEGWGEGGPPPGEPMGPSDPPLSVATGLLVLVPERENHLPDPNDRNVEVRWTAPSTIANIHRLEIQRSEDGGEWVPVETKAPTETSIQQKGLLAQRDYAFRAVSIDHYGRFTSSEPVKYQVPFIKSVRVRESVSEMKFPGFTVMTTPTTEAYYTKLAIEETVKVTTTPASGPSETTETKRRYDHSVNLTAGTETAIGTDSSKEGSGDYEPWQWMNFSEVNPSLGSPNFSQSTSMQLAYSPFGPLNTSQTMSWTLTPAAHGSIDPKWTGMTGTSTQHTSSSTITASLNSNGQWSAGSGAEGPGGWIRQSSEGPEVFVYNWNIPDWFPLRNLWNVPLDEDFMVLDTPAKKVSHKEDTGPSGGGTVTTIRDVTIEYSEQFTPGDTILDIALANLQPLPEIWKGPFLENPAPEAPNYHRSHSASFRVEHREYQAEYFYIDGLGFSTFEPTLPSAFVAKWLVSPKGISASVSKGEAKLICNPSASDSKVHFTHTFQPEDPNPEAGMPPAVELKVIQFTIPKKTEESDTKPINPTVQTEHGGRRNGSHDLSRLPVEMMQHPITAEGGAEPPPVSNKPIRFCRWIDAYPNGVRDNQFAEKDRDRFQVRIPMVLPQLTKMKIKATGLNGAMIGGVYQDKTSDGDYEVDMKAVGGAMVSEPILLVADGDDDKTFNGKGTDDGKNDQTLLGNFGSKIIVSFPELGNAETTFLAQPAIGQIELELVYCSPGGGVPAEMRTRINNQLYQMRGIYRQIGIKVVANDITSLVFPASWLHDRDFGDGNVVKSLGIQGTADLINLLKSSRPASKRIRVGFVDAMAQLNDGAEVEGLSPVGDDPSLVCLDRFARGNLLTLAHEAGHACGLFHQAPTHLLMLGPPIWQTNSEASKRFRSDDADYLPTASRFYVPLP